MYSRFGEIAEDFGNQLSVERGFSQFSQLGAFSVRALPLNTTITLATSPGRQWWEGHTGTGIYAKTPNTKKAGAAMAAAAVAQGVLGTPGAFMRAVQDGLVPDSLDGYLTFLYWFGVSRLPFGRRTIAAAGLYDFMAWMSTLIPGWGTPAFEQKGGYGGKNSSWLSVMGNLYSTAGLYNVDLAQAVPAFEAAWGMTAPPIPANISGQQAQAAADATARGVAAPSSAPPVVPGQAIPSNLLATIDPLHPYGTNAPSYNANTLAVNAPNFWTDKTAPAPPTVVDFATSALDNTAAGPTTQPPPNPANALPALGGGLLLLAGLGLLMLFRRKR